jgi:AAA15 family ATPase/GTPase
MLDGNVNYDFINKWYNVMMQGINPEETPDSAVKRYAGAPFDKDKSYKENSKAICKWIEERMLSHGELELFMQLLAMSSGCKVVLVDSAEIGLHPGVQVCYMHLLSSLYQKGIQVLFSTHSPTTFDLNFSYSNDLFELFGQKE